MVEQTQKIELASATEDEKPESDNPVTNSEVEEIPLLDLTNHFIKPDQFDNMHVLDPQFETMEGAPNFRQIPGFPVFGTGQPTAKGILKILQKANISGKENTRIVWFTMRQEPLVYINGRPFAPRAPDSPHQNIKHKLQPEQISEVESHLQKVLIKRLSESADSRSIVIHTDKEFAENPLDRMDQQENLVVESIQAVETVFYACAEKAKVDLSIIQIPMLEDQMPSEYIDFIIDALKDEPASTPCVFSCQMGKGRTTVGMVAGCLIKEVQLTTELRTMEDVGLISHTVLEKLVSEKFEKTNTVDKDEDDPFINGDFEVINQLLAALPEAKEGKRKMDIIIDKCGPPPKGVGIQNLREAIIETKWKYDVAPEDKQRAFKLMIINFIERYFYMICYATYTLANGPIGYKKRFSEWLDERQDLVRMATDGKDKLEWSRTVDAAKLDQLKELMADPNYKENLPQLIRTIYDFAFLTYADLPRGPIKNNSMRKLAATTLMEILPPTLAEKVNQKLEEDPGMSHDFITIVGMVAYF